MRRLLLVFLFISFVCPIFGQQKAVLFSEEIKKHIYKYNQHSNKAYEKGDLEKGQRLFDSLVQNYLVGTRIDNYVLKCANGKKVKLNKIKRPILLITYSSWCVLNKAEIPALNKIAKKYENDFQMIVLFWDTKKNIQKLANRFNSEIKVCYANEKYTSDEDVVSNLKHYLGFPTSYFMNENLQIIDIQKGNPQIAFKTPFKKALDFDMTFFQKRISNYLLQKDSRTASFANAED
ncbi:MAG: redoxin domain-containing protein [Bacteroidota bacterium]